MTIEISDAVATRSRAFWLFGCHSARAVRLTFAQSMCLRFLPEARVEVPFRSHTRVFSEPNGEAVVAGDAPFLYHAGA